MVKLIRFDEEARITGQLEVDDAADDLAVQQVCVRVVDVVEAAALGDDLVECS